MFLCLVIIAAPTTLIAQKEGNNWFFGKGAGITFNTTPASVVSGGQMNSREGVTSLSDANGRLQFYSDGVKVYDARHQVMPNGTNLMGDNSACQSAIAVPWPGHPNKYLIFTTMVKKGVRYSEIDMTRNSGYGDINTSVKNVPILPDNLSTEKFIITKHCNNVDYWLITPTMNSNNFYVYLISAAGVSAPTIYATGTPIPNDYTAWGAAGILKVSQDGKMLAHLRGNQVMPTLNSFCEIFQFNNQTGAVGSVITSIGNWNQAYGIEFSPDSKIFYVTTALQPYTLMQYDLTATNINASKLLVYQSTNVAFGAMQLGPDGKIYVSGESGFNNGTPFLSTIEQPNVLGMGCDFKYASMNLSPGMVLVGLPTIMTDYVYDAMGIKYTDTCVNKPTTLTLNAPGTVTGINWEFGDGTTGTGIAATHQYAAAGTYTVTAHYSGPCNSGTSQAIIQINGPITTQQKISICNGGTYTLPDGVQVNTAGVYTSVIPRKDGCGNDSTIITTVVLNESYQVTVNAETCFNTTYKLPDGRIVNTSGDYTSTLRSMFGCDSIISTHLRILPQYNTLQTLPICNNEPVTLPDGRIVSAPGTYTSVLKTVVSKCDSTITTNVVTQASQYQIEVVDTCLQAGTTFKVNTTTTAVSWDFGDGQTSTDITATHTYAQSGNYTVTAVATGICSSPITYTRNITIRTGSRETKIIHVCNGNVYTLPDGTITGIAGDYTTILPNIYGCDSTIITTVIVNQPYYSTVDTTICRGSTVVLPDGRTVTASGRYTSHFRSLYDCDSIITTNISYHPDYNTSETINICDGTSYTLPDGRIVNTAGVYTSHLKTYKFLCDSIIISTVNVINAVSETSAEICEGTSYTLPTGNTVNTSGDYISILRSYQGCDSIITTHLIVNPTYKFEVTAEFCESNGYELQDGTIVNKSGTYVVKLQTYKGCDSIYINHLTTVKFPGISLGKDSCLMPGKPLILTPGPGFQTYQWHSGETTPFITVTHEGMYAVRVTNSCGSAAAQIRVIACSQELFVPNAFTPNGDGKNDVFRIINYHGQQLLRFSIYNRWGGEIFTTNNPLKGWDGRINGILQDVGAYVYLIQYKNLEGQERILKGTVTLLK